jgi:hypothetical protein
MAEKTKKKYKALIPASVLAAVLLVGIVVANVLVWQDHLRNRAEAAALTDRIVAVDQKIIDVPAPPEDLAARLEAAQADLAAAETTLPASVNRNDVIDYIINLGLDCGVEAVPLIIEGWAPESPGSSYRVLKLNVTLTGTLAGVTQMLSALQASRYESLTISNLNVERQSTSASSGFNDVTPVKAGINIVIYTSSPPT